MTYLNIVFVGNCGADPELRYLPNGNPVASFSVATNRKYTGSDGQLVKETLLAQRQRLQQASRELRAVPEEGQRRVGGRAAVAGQEHRRAAGVYPA